MTVTRVRFGFDIARSQLGDGKGGAILLLGEAGMGKTHLVDVLRAMHEREARASGGGKAGDEPADGVPDQVGLFVNASKAMESTTPFFMWKGVFEKLFSTRTLHRIVAKTRKVSRPPCAQGTSAPCAPSLKPLIPH